MVANVQAFVDPPGKLRELPDFTGQRWQVKRPVQCSTRRGPVWVYRPIDSGTVLDFAGWSGLDYIEPLAGFVSSDLPGWVIYLRPKDLREFCRELPPSEDGKGQGETVKVRIVDCEEDCHE